MGKFYYRPTSCTNQQRTNHMKLTIEIPDAHTGAILEFVAGLLAKSLPVEESTDPAPGHPELPLESLAAKPVAFVTDALVDETAKFGPVPGEGELPELVRPRLAKADPVEDEGDLRWGVVGELDAPLPDTLPCIVPEVGGFYFLRCGKSAKVQEAHEDSFHGAISIDGEWHPYNWKLDGSSLTSCRDFDIVQDAPF